MGTDRAHGLPDDETGWGSADVRSGRAELLADADRPRAGCSCSTGSDSPTSISMTRPISTSSTPGPSPTSSTRCRRARSTVTHVGGGALHPGPLRGGDPAGLAAARPRAGRFADRVRPVPAAVPARRRGCGSGPRTVGPASAHCGRQSPTSSCSTPSSVAGCRRDLTTDAGHDRHGPRAASDGVLLANLADGPPLQYLRRRAGVGAHGASGRAGRRRSGGAARPSIRQHRARRRAERPLPEAAIRAGGRPGRVPAASAARQRAARFRRRRDAADRRRLDALAARPRTTAGASARHDRRVPTGPRTHTNRARAESFGSAALSSTTASGPATRPALIDDLVAPRPAVGARRRLRHRQGGRLLAARGVRGPRRRDRPADGRGGSRSRPPGRGQRLRDLGRRAGAAFDLIVSGQAWHWIDPDRAGRARPAELLRPGGVARDCSGTSASSTTGRPPRRRRRLRRASRRSSTRRRCCAATGRPSTRSRRRRSGAPDGFDQRRAAQLRWQQTYRRDEWLAI